MEDEEEMLFFILHPSSFILHPSSFQIGQSLVVCPNMKKSRGLRI
jgi:hypothetical protein